MKCQCCKRRRAVWIVGSDGFSSRPGKKVCDAFACRNWGSGGYPVTFRRIEKKTTSR